MKKSPFLQFWGKARPSIPVLLFGLALASTYFSCFKEPGYPRKECEACEQSSDCCCGLSCKDFIIKGGTANGLPVKRCAGPTTTQCK